MANRDVLPKKLVRPNAPKPNAGASAENGSTSATGELVKKLTSNAAISPLNAGRPGRLASFRAERDLTLGAGKPGVDGAAKPKKVFAPTIPARRTKAQDSPAVKEDKPKESFNNNRGRGRGRGDGGPNRGRGRGRPELIQTGGSLFGDGVSDLALKNRSSTSYGDREGSGSSAALEKPKLNTQNVKINKEEEDAALSALLRDDFVDDYELGDGYDHDMVLQPIQLPKTSFDVKDEPEEVKIESEKVITAEGEVKIKQEKDEIKPAPKTTTYQRRLKPSQVTGEHMLQNEGDILFIQLPDVLPSLKPDKERVKVEPGAPKASETPQIVEEKPAKEGVFDDVPEGRLGTLRIHKSGKLTLQMGDHSFVVDSATQVSYLQDLISVEVNTEEKNGKMRALGPVKYKAVCLPDWDNLIDDSDFAC